MSNLFGLSNIGLLGIKAHQRALTLTGSNIANVNTPGYSRRQAVFGAELNGGVRILGIQRLGDHFLDTRLRESNGRLGGRQAAAQGLQLLENAIQEGDNSGVSYALQNFFNALQDLTLQPGGAAERQALRARAEGLLSTLRSTAGSVQNLRVQTDQQLRQEIDRVNTLTASLAEINDRIIDQAGHGENLHNLLDQRDQLISEISAALPVNVLENENGTVTLLAEGGLTLVEQNHAHRLRAVDDPSDHGFAHVGIEGIGGSTTIVDSRLSEGTLAGLLSARDGEMLDTQKRIERLTAELIRNFNGQHRQGTGLDGVSGRDFFSGLAVTATTALGNSGGATIGSTSIFDQAALTTDDYEIRFTAANTFDIVNATTGQTVSAGNAYTSGAAITFDGMSVVISNATGAPNVGDRFHVNAYAGTTNRAGLSPAVQSNTDAIAAGLSDDRGDNRNALELAALRDLAFLGEGGDLTFEGYYNLARTSVGQAAQTAIHRLSEEEAANFQIKELADAARAVSMDEEAANLVQYQRAFEASSRVIRMSDELMQTILNFI